MAIAQEIYSTGYTQRDALCWQIPAGDPRFYDGFSDGVMWGRGLGVPQMFSRGVQNDRVRIPFDGIAGLEFGAGAALEIVGRRARSQKLKGAGRFLMGAGGGYFILTRAHEVLSRIAPSREVTVYGNHTPTQLALPPSAAHEIVPATATQTPSLTPEPTVTPTFTSTPTPNVFERYNLFPTPTLLPNQTPLPDGGLYARYLVGKEQGEILQGYTQGIQPGADGAMRYVLNPDSLAFSEGWPQYGQIYGAWPIPPTDQRMSISVYCSDPCVLKLVNAKDQQVIREFQAVYAESDDTTKQYLAYTELPAVTGTDTWIVLEPREPGATEPLWHARVEYGPVEEPEIVMAKRANPYTGEISDAPTIAGVATIPGSEEEIALREQQTHVVVAKRVGRAEQWWQDVITTDDGWKHVTVSVNRDELSIPYGDTVTAKVIAPVYLTAGYHDIKIRCDDHCTVSFASPYGAKLGEISYTLDKREKGEIRDEHGYLTKTIFLGTDTPWIIIELDDAYGGAGFEVQVMP